MTRDVWLQYFEQAPEPVQHYLLDSASGAAESAAQEALGFEHDTWDRVMDCVWSAIFEKLGLGEVQARLNVAAAGRDSGLVEKVVLQKVLYPLGDLLPWDIDVRLQELGVPAEEIQAGFRISLRPISYGAAVRRIAAEAKISLLGEESVRRLREVFVSYQKNIRTVEQVREILRRSMADGGLGWSADQVEAFLAAIIHVTKQVPVLSEEEYSRWLQQTQREAEVARLEQMRKDKQVILTPTTDGVVARPMGTSGFASVVDQAVEEAVALANVQGLDDYLMKRFRNAISTRLRGVRNRKQVEEVLGRDAKVGGLGQAPDEIKRIADVIEQIYNERHLIIEQEERQKVESFVLEQKKRIDQRQKTESEEREKWYQEKLQAVAQGETGSVAALKAIMRGVKVVGPVCEPGQSPQVIVQGDQPSGRVVDGIQGTVRLMSLIEEVQTLDVAGFRRMGKTAEEARQKMAQKFQALRQESEDRWIEGVKRWRESPLQQAYLSLVADAFRQQKTVIEIATERQQLGGKGLTPEEVGVLIDLNQQLAF